ncbi:hypothetical protein, partial [Bifidobacterium adolescentis]
VLFTTHSRPFGQAYGREQDLREAKRRRKQATLRAKQQPSPITHSSQKIAIQQAQKKKTTRSP